MIKNKAILEKPKGLKLIISIVNRGTGNLIKDKLATKYAHLQIISLGKGTVNKDILDLFGLASTEKDIVFSIIDEKDESVVLSILNNEFAFNKKVTGIACSIDVDSVGGLRSLQILLGQLEGGL